MKSSPVTLCLLQVIYSGESLSELVRYWYMIFFSSGFKDEYSDDKRWLLSKLLSKFNKGDADPPESRDASTAADDLWTILNMSRSPNFECSLRSHPVKIMIKKREKNNEKNKKFLQVATSITNSTAGKGRRILLNDSEVMWRKLGKKCASVRRKVSTEVSLILAISGKLFRITYSYLWRR